MIKDIPVDAVLVPIQPRTADGSDNEALADDIARNGLITPITVFAEGDKYALLSGQRRLQVVKERGEKTITAYIRPRPSEQNVLPMQVGANNSRPLSPAQLAWAIRVHFLRRNLEALASNEVAVPGRDLPDDVCPSTPLVAPEENHAEAQVSYWQALEAAWLDAMQIAGIPDERMAAQKRWYVPWAKIVEELGLRENERNRKRIMAVLRNLSPASVERLLDLTPSKQPTVAELQRLADLPPYEQDSLLEKIGDVVEALNSLPKVKPKSDDSVEIDDDGYLVDTGDSKLSKEKLPVGLIPDGYEDEDAPRRPSSNAPRPPESEQDAEDYRERKYDDNPFAEGNASPRGGSGGGTARDGGYQSTGRDAVDEAFNAKAVNYSDFKKQVDALAEMISLRGAGLSYADLDSLIKTLNALVYQCERLAGRGRVAAPAPQPAVAFTYEDLDEDEPDYDEEEPDYDEEEDEQYEDEEENG
jgi:uncharacterized ParB-like nuclease family protein